MSTWPARAGPPSSRTFSVTPAASPPPALAPAIDELVRVEPELGLVGRHPQQTRVAVVDRGGVRVLRRQPVLHRDQDGVEVVDPVDDGARPEPPITDDHPAAVDVVDRRSPGLAVGRARRW